MSPHACPCPLIVKPTKQARASLTQDHRCMLHCAAAPSAGLDGQAAVQHSLLQTKQPSAAPLAGQLPPGALTCGFSLAFSCFTTPPARALRNASRPTAAPTNCCTARRASAARTPAAHGSAQRERRSGISGHWAGQARQRRANAAQQHHEWHARSHGKLALP